MTHPLYSDMVAALKKPGEQILDTLTPVKCDLLHMSFALSGEVGELQDAIKKFVFYNKLVLDDVNVVEELGDIEFYLEGLRQCLGITREETLAANQDKLSVRYKGLQYTDKAAHDRADKQ